MDNLMAKWKSTIDAQKERQKSVGRSQPSDPEAKDTEFLKTQTKKIIDILLPDQDPPGSTF